ncbi:lipase 3-like [Amyelois transitella]|uniref:lipase 3-like n=1 Tax=Amyelois transitella TaxID=680683 RepID=UPI00067E14EC|nr:lipase 3-like [Amyelois transitella]
MFWQFVIFTILFKSCYGSNGCTPFSAKNLGSVNSTLLSSLLEPIKDHLPVFNSSTVPNLDAFIEDFNAGSNNEDIHLNITQILSKYGYGPEQHQVNSGGYLLDIFRIPGNGSVVLLNHGLFSSSDDLISTGPDLGLPYLLADLGYDVWLGNSRGNLHGRKHESLSPDCAEFWQFTWDDIGRYDVPAIIDYILNVTNKKQLAFIGHSQGTTTYFVMASELPEYNDKISVMIALSSVTYLSHTQNPLIKILATISDPGNVLTQAIGLYELVPRNELTNAITTTACGTPELATIFCENLMFFALGADYSQINATLLPAFFAHYPGGGATKQLVHYGQLINSGKFRQFDHGVVGNVEKYGKISPPDYPLEKVRSKVMIFTADNDNFFSAPADRAKLIARLPNVVEVYNVPYPQFTHMDFILAKDLRKLAYPKVLEVLKKYA